MNIQNTKHTILRNISNIPGWRTSKRIIVLESDDWGSIRMPSNKTFEKLKDELRFASDGGFIYNKYDSLATNQDLSSLFEVLSSIKDSNNRPAVFTPLAIVANPDFKKISESEFNDYYFEPFSNTFKSYPGCSNSYRLWLEGIGARLFLPQFHGREHLNVKTWMRALNIKHGRTVTAFNNGMWGISTANDKDIRLEFQAAFDFFYSEDLEYHKEVIVSGLNLFEELFGYRASYFVPPNGPFSLSLESVCFSEGIKYLFRSKRQREPVGEGISKARIFVPGQKSKSGLTYMSRNCFFEPVQPGKDWVDSCLSEISIAFRWNKPAIISTHRVNYIGALHKSNRDNGLKSLNILLDRIMKSWPDAMFLTTSELGELINK